MAASPAIHGPGLGQRVRSIRVPVSEPHPPASQNLTPADPAPRAASRAAFPKPIAGRIVVPGMHPGDGRDAVSLPLELMPPPPDATVAVRRSPAATLCLLLALAVLIAVDLIGADSGFRTFRYGIWLATFVLALAAVASCVPAALWREGSLLAWNALGLTVGVLALGVLGVSSMLALPPVLVGIALTSWPRPASSTSTSTPQDASGAARGVGVDGEQRVALVSGLLVIPLLALVEWLFLRGGRG